MPHLMQLALLGYPAALLGVDALEHGASSTTVTWRPEVGPLGNTHETSLAELAARRTYDFAAADEQRQAATQQLPGTDKATNMSKMQEAVVNPNGQQVDQEADSKSLEANLVRLRSSMHEAAALKQAPTQLPGTEPASDINNMPDVVVNEKGNEVEPESVYMDPGYSQEEIRKDWELRNINLRTSESMQRWLEFEKTREIQCDLFVVNLTCYPQSEWIYQNISSALECQAQCWRDMTWVARELPNFIVWTGPDIPVTGGICSCCQRNFVLLEDTKLEVYRCHDRDRAVVPPPTPSPTTPSPTTPAPTPGPTPPDSVYDAPYGGIEDEVEPCAQD